MKLFKMEGHSAHYGTYLQIKKVILPHFKCPAYINENLHTEHVNFISYMPRKKSLFNFIFIQHE